MRQRWGRAWFGGGRGRPVQAPAFPRFVLLYGALFAGLGAASPFLPGLLEQRGLGPSEIGTVLAAGTAIRLVAGPAGCRLADRLGLPRRVMAGLIAASAALALGYLLPGGFGAMLLVGLLHASVLAPILPLADSLAVAAAPGRFQYGWVRGAGSAAFILGAAGAGQVIEATSLGSIVWMNAGLLFVAALAAVRVPEAPAVPPVVRERVDALALLRLPGFMRMLLVAALVLGSHALHDGFEVLRWREAGIGPGAAGLLWSESVLAEVVVFLVLGAPLLRWLGPGGAAMLAAAAGVVRWGTTAVTGSLPAMLIVEPLHGLTFALLHLACMQVIADTVPRPLAATAQAAYGTVAVGAVSAGLTFASGRLYGTFGPGAFWVMAALCAVALPLASGRWATAPGR